MRFLHRTDPARAEALALCSCLLNLGLDARALLPQSHTAGMDALADERCPPWVGPALADLFAAARGEVADPEGPEPLPAEPGPAHPLVPRGLPQWAPPRELCPTLFLPQPAVLFQIAENAPRSADGRSVHAEPEARARARALPPPRRLF